MFDLLNMSSSPSPLFSGLVGIQAPPLLEQQDDLRSTVSLADLKQSPSTTSCNSKEIPTSYSATTLQQPMPLQKGQKTNLRNKGMPLRPGHHRHTMSSNRTPRWSNACSCSTCCLTRRVTRKVWSWVLTAVPIAQSIFQTEQPDLRAIDTYLLNSRQKEREEHLLKGYIFIMLLILPVFQFSLYFLRLTNAMLSVTAMEVFLSFVLLALKSGFILCSKLLFLASWPIFIFIYSCLLGSHAGYQFLLFPASILPFTLFSMRTKRSCAFLFLIYAGCYLFLESLDFMPHLRDPRAARAAPWVRMITASVSFLLLIAYVRNFRLTNWNAEQLLAQERGQVFRILSEVLPPGVIRRLQGGEVAIADHVNDATVMFIDVVGFTEMSAHLPARMVVDNLHTIYSQVDSLLARYPAIEKIKTIGDSYMFVAGLGRDQTGVMNNRPETPVEGLMNMVKLAMDITHHPFTIASGTNETVGIQFRIGIHIGEIICGIIPQHRYIFDVWGDTVNTASRMETYGQPGMIHVSQKVRDLLHDRYIFIRRNVLRVKGKGMMQTYFLVSPKEAPSPWRRLHGHARTGSGISGITTAHFPSLTRRRPPPRPGFPRTPVNAATSDTEARGGNT